MIRNSCCYWHVSRRAGFGCVSVSVFLEMGWNAAVPVFGGRVRFYQAGGSERRQSRRSEWRCFGRGRPSADGNFLSVAAAYGSLWQLSYQYSTYKGIAGQQEPVSIHLSLSALTDGVKLPTLWVFIYLFVFCWPGLSWTFSSVQLFSSEARLKGNLMTQTQQPEHLLKGLL